MCISDRLSEADFDYLQLNKNYRYNIVFVGKFLYVLMFTLCTGVV